MTRFVQFAGIWPRAREMMWAGYLPSWCRVREPGTENGSRFRRGVKKVRPWPPKCCRLLARAIHTIPDLARRSDDMEAIVNAGVLAWKAGWPRYLTGCLVFWLFMAAGPSHQLLSAAQSGETPNDGGFLVGGLDELDESALASAEARNWLMTLRHLGGQRDPRRQYLFLPVGAGGSALGRAVELDWQPGELGKLRGIAAEQARVLFERASKGPGDGAGADTWQQLHEVLFWDPDHAAARKVLGHRGGLGEWQVLEEKVRIREATRPHPLMNWPAGSWRLAESAHFSVAAQAGEAETLELVRLAERWRWVWQQVFFDFWSSGASLQRTLDGDAPRPRNNRRHDVILFGSRDEYIAQLRERIPGVEQSTGYYSDQQTVSFFYVDQSEAVLATWRHELAHQFFQETVKARPGVFDEGWLWLGEGIAMYMESLQDHGPFATLGGFDASRLQYSRLRRFREDFFVRSSELAQLSLAQFQARTDIRDLYSQSAGMVQLLMTDGAGKHRDGLIAFLQMLYAGRLKPDAWKRTVGLELAGLDEAYSPYLAVQPDDFKRYLLNPARVRELALNLNEGATPLDDEAFARLGQCTALEWLDLSGQPLTAPRIASLAPCASLGRLFLTGCDLDDDTLRELANLPGLAELDVSRTNITDVMLAELRKSRSELKISR